MPKKNECAEVFLAAKTRSVDFDQLTEAVYSLSSVNKWAKNNLDQTDQDEAEFSDSLEVTLAAALRLRMMLKMECGLY